MLSETELVNLAREIKHAQDHATQLRPFGSRVEGFDEDAAYAIADLIRRERIEAGATPVGRKIGFSNPAMWLAYGVRAPIWGYMYDATVEFASGATARCDLRPFVDPKLEPEVVLHFHSAPARTGGLAGILDAIDWIAHGFEVVQSHYPDWKFCAADTIADGGLHARLLIGEPQPIDRLDVDLARRLERFSLSLFTQDERRDHGTGANVLGSPLLAVAHLMEVLAKQPRFEPIRAGDLITTGTITAAHAVSAGQRWRTEIEGIGLPGFTVEFVYGPDGARPGLP